MGAIIGGVGLIYVGVAFLFGIAGVGQAFIAHLRGQPIPNPEQTLTVVAFWMVAAIAPMVGLLMIAAGIQAIAGAGQ